MPDRTKRGQAAAALPAAALVALVLLAAALIRLRTLGDVAAHGDEQFYLLVGDRIWNHRAIPYVDIWDRKPVGLFLIYAGIRALGGEGIVQYQLVATLVAGATAAMIALWVSRAAGALAAFVAALLYLLILQTHLGFGGQTEVFLNLLLLGAGWICFDLLGRGGERALLWHGMAAMALAGVALQIKPTALFPGLWLGLTLLWIANRARLPLARIAAYGAAWIAAALAPTALVIGWYAAAGHLDAWWFANVVSILEKGGTREGAALGRTIALALRLGIAFTGAIAVLGVTVLRRRDGDRRGVWFLIGWLISAVVAYFAVSAAYPHYGLIMAPMACLLVGFAAGQRPLGWVIVAGAVLLGGRLFLNDLKHVEVRQMLAPQIEAMAARIRPELARGGCLYVHHGPVILYMLTRSCLPSRFAFPDHLSTAAEATGLASDPGDETRRILSARPPVIVTGRFSFIPGNGETQALVDAAVARDYEPVAAIRDAGGRVLFTAYRLKGSSWRPAFSP